MSSMIEKLWPSFYEEVTQQLGNLTEMLKDPENLEVDVDQSFRDFHTIGSSCAMMGFSSMEVIARTAEDLLGRIRNVDLELTVEINASLLEAAKCLTNQLAMAGESKANPTAFPDVIKSLKSFIVEG